MKRLNLILLLFLVLPLSSIAQTVITYSYDEAGNRISRTSSIEVATIPGPLAVNESKIIELDFVQNQLYCRAENSHILKFGNSGISDDMVFGKPRTADMSQFILSSVRFPVYITQTINIEYKI